MEETLIGIAAYALGVLSGRWYARRPRKVKQEDRDAGLRRYQAQKGR